MKHLIEKQPLCNIFISTKQTDKTKMHMSKVLKGFKQSEESKMKKSIALKGRKKNPDSVKRGAKNRMKKVASFNKKTSEEIIFNSVNELCENYKELFSQASLKRYLGKNNVPNIKKSDYDFYYVK